MSVRMAMRSVRPTLAAVLGVVLGLTLLESASTLGAPAGYPSRPVEFIVPFNPGGGADVAQRTFNRFAEPLAGQRLVVINKPGAGGVTGWSELVRARPDGYTLSIVTPPFNVIPALVNPAATGYRLEQFTNICVYSVVPDVLYVRANSPFRTLQDLVDFARRNPGRVIAANTGALGADHLTTLLIENATGTQFTQLPFTGGAESLQATLAGTTDVMVGSATYIESQRGQLRPLAIASPRRDPHFPDVPTFREQGYDVVAERYRAIAGPPGLPEGVVQYWADLCRRVSEMPEFQEAMNRIGQPPAYLGPAEATEAINRMADDIRMVIEKYGLRQ